MIAPGATAEQVVETVRVALTAAGYRRAVDDHGDDVDSMVREIFGSPARTHALRFCVDECDVLEQHGVGQERTPTRDDYLSDLHDAICRELGLDDPRVTVIPAGRLVETLPPGTWVVRADGDGDLVGHPTPTRIEDVDPDVNVFWRSIGREYDWQPPLRLGDELVDARGFARCSVGTVARLGRTYALAVRGPNGWTADREPVDVEHLLAYASAPGYGPWRVIDLPAPTDSQESPA